jgi:S-adenosylmethionine/arginine decarboxylase-like enzyme
MLVHKHLIIRAEINNPPTNADWATQWLSELASKIGMKVCMGPISSYVDMPGNRGLTSVVVIETSHMAVHFWDEESPGLLQMDVYTCGKLDTNIIFKELDQFAPTKIQYKYLDREHELVEIPINP